MNKIAFALVLTTLTAALVGASAPATRVRSFDIEHSKMTVNVYKQGLFAFAADNHVVSAPIRSGSLDERTNTVVVTVDAAKMRIIDQRVRFGSREQIQANMVGPQVLDVAKFPTISFRSTRIEATRDGHLNVTGDLTLHGQMHLVSFAVTRSDPSHFSGSATVRQTAFGITPIRIAGGSVKVKDDVTVTFQIALK
jgi:polyisoprenoid-binding protein YceI